MSRTWSLCVALSLAVIVINAEGRTAPQYDRDDPEEDYDPRHRRSSTSEDELATPWLGLGKRQPSFTPYVSVGVLSDMQQFFDNLRTNLDSLETLPAEQRDALLGNTQSLPEKDQYFRPAATAAYLHAMRNQRPSFKIRNFVESPEPATLRGTNHYDPSLLWTGLGRRRR